MKYSSQYYVTSFYLFEPIENPQALENKIKEFATSVKIEGLVILSSEGINSTISSQDSQDLKEFKTWLSQLFKNSIDFKDSISDRVLFHEFKIKRRPEIVTLGVPELVPSSTPNATHLSPEQWQMELEQDPEIVLIDTRNSYETKVGTFAGAIDPEIDQFTDFPDAVEVKLQIDKNKKIFIFCTGGIRCEKATIELNRRGYSKVYQLHGGILRYLERFPNKKFEGECFVFDYRVAVDQHLNPSTRYTLCPHCGQPADQKIRCVRCDTQVNLCVKCKEIDLVGLTCSKNCAHHYRMRPHLKGDRQVPFYVQS